VETIAPLLGAALVASMFFVGGWASKLGHGRAYLSFAGGIAVTYVFLDLLPELATMHEVVLEHGGEHRLFHGEESVYGGALLGVVVFYALTYLIRAGRARGRGPGTVGAGGDATYWVHVLGYGVYGLIIGYLISERLEHGIVSLAVYSVAMAFHFFTVDHSLRHEHKAAYERTGRWLMAGLLMLGGVLGALGSVSELQVARAFAFIAGGIIITTLKEEVPEASEGRFWPFLFGVAVYSLLLLLA
jgi:zinc transporter ZupT